MPIERSTPIAAARGIPCVIFFDALTAEQRERRIQSRLGEALKEDERLFCAACRALITHRSEAMNMQGAHAHRVTNPLGLTFRIACFRAAPGCGHAGRETESHTWFPGFAWRVALCAGCGNHLGWRFRGARGRFYGLILDRLTSQSG